MASPYASAAQASSPDDMDSWLQSIGAKGAAAASSGQVDPNQSISALIKAGTQAIASGQVSPTDAAAKAKQMGMPVPAKLPPPAQVRKMAKQVTASPYQPTGPDSQPTAAQLQAQQAGGLPTDTVADQQTRAAQQAQQNQIAQNNQQQVMAQMPQAPSVAQPGPFKRGSGQSAENMAEVKQGSLTKAETGTKNTQSETATDEQSRNNSNEIDNGQKVTASNGAQDTSGQTDTSRFLQTLTPEQIQSLYQTGGASAPGQNVSQGEQAIQNMINMEANRPVVTNYAHPLMALADALSLPGKETHFAEGMPAGQETAAGRNARILEYMQKLQSDKDANMRNMVAQIQAAKGGFIQNALMQKLVNDQKTGVEDTSGTKAIASQGQKLTNTAGNTAEQSANNTQQNTIDTTNMSKKSAQDPNAAQKGFINPVTAAGAYNSAVEKSLGQDDKDANELNTLIGTLAAGKPVDDNMIGALASRFITGSLRFNPQEAKLLSSGDQSVLSRAQQAAESISNGTLTSTNRLGMLQAFQIMAQGKQVQRNMLANRAKGLGSNYMQSAQNVANVLPDSYVNAYGPAVDMAKAASARLLQQGAGGFHGGDGETGVGFVQMMNPATGRTGPVSAANVAAAKAKGFTEVK